MAISTIGVAARDYVDLSAWIADLPATYTEDQIAEMYNDAEFTSASQITLSGVNPNGFKTIIRCAPGESFRDSGNHLRYDPANGVAIRKTSGYDSVFSLDIADTEIYGLQISTTNVANTIALSETQNLLAVGNLIQSSSNLRAINTSGNPSTYINNIIIVDDGASSTTLAFRIVYSAPTIINNTIICTFAGHTGFGLEKLGGTSDNATVINNAIFGFGTPMESGAWGSGTDYNATDKATLPVGSNNQTSLVFADQFENVASDATLDLRLKTGNSLDNNGTPQSAFTDDEDIFFTVRSGTTPSIGAFETASAPSGTTSSVAVTWPMFEVSAVQASDAPAISSSVAVTWPMFEVSAVQASDAPAISSSVSVTWPMFEVSAVQASDAPAISSSVAVTWPMFEVSAVQASDAPAISSSVSVTWPMFEVSAVQASDAPAISSSVAVTWPMFEVSAIVGEFDYYTDPSARIDIVSASRRIDIVSASRRIDL